MKISHHIELGFDPWVVQDPVEERSRVQDQRVGFNLCVEREREREGLVRGSELRN